MAIPRVVGLIAVVAVIGFGVAGRAAAQDQPSAEEARYLGQMDALVSIMSASFQRVVALTDNPRINDLDWQNDFIGETSVWKAVYEAAVELDPPERLEELHAEALPDLVVFWGDRPAARLDRVTSPQFGEVHRRGVGSGRSGNHTDDAWAIVMPGQSRLVPLGRMARIIDIGATVCHLLDASQSGLSGYSLLDVA